LAVDSLDNKIPIGRARNRTASIYRTQRSNGEQRAKFQGDAVRKATAIDGCGCSKSELQVIHTNPICPGRHLIASAQNSSTHSSVVSIGLGEARRHELDKFRERVAVVEPEFRSTLSKKAFSGLLAMAFANDALGPSHCAVAVRRHDLGLLKRDEGCTLVYSRRTGPSEQVKMNFRFSQELPANRSTMLGAFAIRRSRSSGRDTCALIGIAMYDTASGWLMTTFDLNPFDVSLLHTATTLPIFLFTLPAGAIADIVDPRRMIIAVSYAIAALMTIFAAVVALDFVSPVLLLLTTFVLSTTVP
jgi:hypothetical protein